MAPNSALILDDCCAMFTLFVGAAQGGHGVTGQGGGEGQGEGVGQDCRSWPENVVVGQGGGLGHDLGAGHVSLGQDGGAGHDSAGLETTFEIKYEIPAATNKSGNLLSVGQMEFKA